MKTDTALLGDLLIEVRNGIDADQHDKPLNNSMLPVSRIETIADGTIDFKRVKYSNFTKSEIEKYQLKQGDILFSHINSPAHIAKTAIFKSTHTLIHGINLLLLRTDAKRCNPAFLNYYLKSNDVRARFRARCKKAVNQASLNQSDIASLKVPTPTLSEQERIASILDKADRLRRTRRYAQQLSDTFLQSVFVKMFGDPVKNPKGWELYPFTCFCEKITDGTHFSPPEVSTGIPYITAKNIKRAGIDLSNLTYVSEAAHKEIYKRCDPQVGDVLYIKDGATTGIAKVNTLPFEFSMLSSLALLRTDSGKMSSYFLENYLNHPSVFQQITSQMKGGAIQRLTIDKIKELRAIVPPLPLQQEFALVAQRFERVRAQQREATRQAEHLFQTLLHRAFRGEL